MCAELTKQRRGGNFADFAILLSVIITIIIIERKDLRGVMSKDCKDTLQTLKTVTKCECDAK